MDDTGQRTHRNVLGGADFSPSPRFRECLIPPYLLQLPVCSGLAPCLLVWTLTGPAHMSLFCCTLLDAWTVSKPHLDPLRFSLRGSLAWWWLASAELAPCGSGTCGIHTLPRRT